MNRTEIRIRNLRKITLMDAIFSHLETGKPCFGRSVIDIAEELKAMLYADRVPNETIEKSKITVEEIKKEKARLEENLTMKIIDFQDETGVMVDDVELQSIVFVAGGRESRVVTKIQIF